MLPVVLCLALAAPVPFPKTQKPPAVPHLPPGEYILVWGGAEVEMTLSPSGEYRWGCFVGYWSYKDGVLCVHEYRPDDQDDDYRPMIHWYVKLNHKWAGTAVYPFRPGVPSVAVSIRRK